MIDLPALSEAKFATVVTDRDAVELYKQAPASELLSESLDEQAFVMFFASTGSHSERWGLGTGWDALEEGVWFTPLQSDEPIRTGPRWRADVEVSEPNPIDKSISDRIVLLARKYVARDSFTDEEAARLAIVTERMRQLMPSVSPDEVQRMEGLLSLVREADQTDVEIRAALRIAEPKRKPSKKG